MVDAQTARASFTPFTLPTASSYGFENRQITPSSAIWSDYHHSMPDGAQQLPMSAHPSQMAGHGSTYNNATTAGVQTTATDADFDTPSEPYAVLIFKALRSAPGHRMVLKEIYAWFENNTDKAKGASKGWQNSIRHNLSMNGVSFAHSDEIQSELTLNPRPSRRLSRILPVQMAERAMFGF
jgi:hypothetical protein